jgi:hypothetical protein
MSAVQRLLLPYQPARHQQAVHAVLSRHRFVVAALHRRAGKTVLAVNHLIVEALRHPGRSYGYVAPFRNQAKAIGWGLLKQYTAPIPGMQWNESELVARFPTGSTIRLMGVDNDTGIRGMGFDGLVCDEVADMPSDSWQLVLRPTLARTGGWCLFISTPRGVGNLFHDLWVQAQSEPGWAALSFRADQTGAIPAAELAAMRREMTDSRFRQEMLVDFSAANEDVLIPIDLASEASSRLPSEADFGWAARVIGVDPARFGGDRSVIIRRQGLLCHPPMVFQGLDLMALVGRIAMVIAEWSPDAVFVDGGGLGAGVVDRLRQLGYDVVEVQFGGRPTNGRFVNKRAEMWTGMRDWLQAGGAIPADGALAQDLSLPTYDFDAAGRLRLESKDDMKKRGGRSTDLGDALALTFAQPVSPKRRFDDPATGAMAGHPQFCLHEYDPFAEAS